MVDIAGLTHEQFEDFAGGLTVAIRVLKSKRDQADKSLLSQRASSYDDYLKKFERVQILSDLISELEDLKTQRGENA